MPRTTVAGALQETSFYGAVAFFFVLAAFPFYWMVITSFKTNADLYNVTNIPFWFNDPPTLEHFRYLFEKTLFATWLLNSLIIGLCVVAITLVTALPAAYSLARMTGRNGEALGHRHLPDLPGAADASVPAAVAGHRRCWACRIRCGRWCWSIRPSPSRSAPGC